MLFRSQARLSKLGVSYLQQKQLDIAQTAAGNEGAGNFMGIGMGLGVGNNLGEVVGNSIKQSGLTSPLTGGDTTITFLLCSKRRTNDRTI